MTRFRILPALLLLALSACAAPEDVAQTSPTNDVAVVKQAATLPSYVTPCQNALTASCRQTTPLFGHITIYMGSTLPYGPIGQFWYNANGDAFDIDLTAAPYFRATVDNLETWFPNYSQSYQIVQINQNLGNFSEWFSAANRVQPGTGICFSYFMCYYKALFHASSPWIVHNEWPANYFPNSFYATNN